MIQARHVTRRFGAVTAVDDVSFEVRAGEIVGFLGPNGAGKSTLLKMLATYLPPDSGELVVAGFDVRREPLEVRARLGYLTEHNALFESMRVERYLAFVEALQRSARGADWRSRREWAIARCALGEVLAKRIGECSKGFRQRIGLAAALIHDPPVLLLDEPTHGLDPLQVVAFREFLGELRPGRAILFSSHILSEVAAISDRLLGIQAGRLVLDERVEVLQARARDQRVTLEEIVLASVRRAPDASTLGARS